MAGKLKAQIAELRSAIDALANQCKDGWRTVRYPSAKKMPPAPAAKTPPAPAVGQMPTAPPSYLSVVRREVHPPRAEAPQRRVETQHQPMVVQKTPKTPTPVMQRPWVVCEVPAEPVTVDHATRLLCDRWAPSFVGSGTLLALVGGCSPPCCPDALAEGFVLAGSATAIDAVIDEEIEEDDEISEEEVEEEEVEEVQAVALPRPTDIASAVAVAAEQAERHLRRLEALVSTHESVAAATLAQAGLTTWSCGVSLFCPCPACPYAAGCPRAIEAHLVAGHKRLMRRLLAGPALDALLRVARTAAPQSEAGPAAASVAQEVAILTSALSVQSAELAALRLDREQHKVEIEKLRRDKDKETASLVAACQRQCEELAAMRRETAELQRVTRALQESQSLATQQSAREESLVAELQSLRTELQAVRTAEGAITAKAEHARRVAEQRAQTIAAQTAREESLAAELRSLRAELRAVRTAEGAITAEAEHARRVAEQRAQTIAAQTAREEQLASELQEARHALQESRRMAAYSVQAVQDAEGALAAEAERARLVERTSQVEVAQLTTRSEALTSALHMAQVACTRARESEEQCAAREQQLAAELGRALREADELRAREAELSRAIELAKHEQEVAVAQSEERVRALSVEVAHARQVARASAERAASLESEVAVARSELDDERAAGQESLAQMSGQAARVLTMERARADAAVATAEQVRMGFKRRSHSAHVARATRCDDECCLAAPLPTDDDSDAPPLQRRRSASVRLPSPVERSPSPQEAPSAGNERGV